MCPYPIDYRARTVHATGMKNAAAAPTTKCNITYTSRDGGSTLKCTEPKGHRKGGLAGHGHYSDGR